MKQVAFSLDYIDAMTLLNNAHSRLRREKHLRASSKFIPEEGKAHMGDVKIAKWERIAKALDEAVSKAGD